MFRQYAAHGNLAKICRWLEGQGILPPGMVHNDKGAHWYSQTIRLILLHPIYKGRATYGRRELLTDENRVSPSDPERKIRPQYLRTTPEESWIFLDAPPLVEEALWDACQRRLLVNVNEKKAQLGGNPRRKQMLSSLVRCGACGYRMSTWTRKGQPYRYYRCGNHYCKDAPQGYNRSPAAMMEEMTVKNLIHVAEHPDLVDEAMRAYDDHQKQQQTGNAPAERRKLQNDLEEIRQKEDTTAEAQIEARMSGRSSVVYDRMLTDLSCRRLEIEEKLYAMRPINRDANAARAENMGQKMAKIILAMEKVLTAAEEDFAPSEKQEILRRIIERVTPCTDGIELILMTDTVYYVKTYKPAEKSTAPKPADPPVP